MEKFKSRVGLPRTEVGGKNDTKFVADRPGLVPEQSVDCNDYSTCQTNLAEGNLAAQIYDTGGKEGAGGILVTAFFVVMTTYLTTPSLVAGVKQFVIMGQQKKKAFDSPREMP